MDEYQDSLQDYRKQLEAQQRIQVLENLVRTKLTKKALERYGNLKVAYPEKATQLLLVLAQAVQTQQINVINDEQLKELLKKMSPKKRKFTIKRR